MPFSWALFQQTQKFSGKERIQPCGAVKDVTVKQLVILPQDTFILNVYTHEVLPLLTSNRILICEAFLLSFPVDAFA